MNQLIYILIRRWFHRYDCFKVITLLLCYMTTRFDELPPAWGLSTIFYVICFISFIETLLQLGLTWTIFWVIYHHGGHYLHCNTVAHFSHSAIHVITGIPLRHGWTKQTPTACIFLLGIVLPHLHGRDFNIYSLTVLISCQVVLGPISPRGFPSQLEFHSTFVCS